MGSESRPMAYPADERRVIDFALFHAKSLPQYLAAAARLERWLLTYRQSGMPGWSETLARTQSFIDACDRELAELERDERRARADFVVFHTALRNELADMTAYRE